VFNRSPSHPHNAEINPLLPLELRSNALDAATATMHASQSISLRVSLHCVFCRKSGSFK
jgi:hypothetical protein